MGFDGAGGKVLLFRCSQLPFGDALRAIHGSLVSPDSMKSCRAGFKIMDTEELAPNYLEGDDHPSFSHTNHGRMFLKHLELCKE